MPRRKMSYYSAIVKVNTNPSLQKEVEVPVILARNERQATVFAHFAVRALGLQPRHAGTKIQRHIPKPDAVKAGRSRRARKDSLSG
jgi:hypothetical protein